MRNLREKIQGTNTKIQLFIGTCILLLGSFAMIHPIAEAAYLPLTYRYDHHLFEINPNSFPSWRGTEEVWVYNGREAQLPAELRVDGDQLPPLPKGMIRSTRVIWDLDAIAGTIRSQIASKIDREPGSATIILQESGAVVFEGVGMLGREVDLKQAARLTVAALEQGVIDIILPMRELQPQLTIDPKLQKKGILEVISVGESDYSGSPWARRLNINTGLSKFNGHIIPEGEIFSFNETLGHVGPTTGYYKELVIKGEETLPDYGGGLCQVSTTAYRGVWEYGFPIDQRRNHSYAVLYYSPHGTDATIYPPATDMKFINDSPGDILIQTYNNTGSDLAYFIYYGTKDDRETDLIGPYTWGHVPAPPDKTSYTTEIAPGERRKAGGRVPGLKAMWYRIVRPGDESDETVESYYSVYQARPLYYQIGVAKEPMGPAEAPSWIDVPPTDRSRARERRKRL